MSSNHKLSAAAALAALALSAAAANAQTLTRIETHAFYGATVTVEEGVRVFRPLPSTGHMIINPGGRTPVSLNVTESVHHYVTPPVVAGGGNGGGWVAGGGGGGLAWVPGDGRGKHGHRGHRMGGNPGPGGGKGGMKHIHAGGLKGGHHGGHH